MAYLFAGFNSNHPILNYNMEDYLKQVPFKGCYQAGSDYCAEKCSSRVCPRMCDYWHVDRNRIAFFAWLYDNRPHLNFLSEGEINGEM